MPSLRDAPRTAGFAYAFLTNHRGTENIEERGGDRSLGVLDIAFLFRAKSQQSDRLLQIFYTCTM